MTPYRTLNVGPEPRRVIMRALLLLIELDGSGADAKIAEELVKLLLDT